MRLNTMRGDTIIEVMLAFTVFAMLAVGAMSIMNQGVASAQEALETTLVRQEIDSQAEALRYLHQAYMDKPDSASGQRFQTIRDQNVADVNPTKFGADTDPDGSTCLAAIPSGSGVAPAFVINPKTIKIVDDLKAMDEGTAPAYAQLQFNGDGTLDYPYGLWIEAIKGDVVTGQPEFIDFHIRACWYSVTSEAPRTLGTIVRLYVPAV